MKTLILFVQFLFVFYLLVSPVIAQDEPLPYDPEKQQESVEKGEALRNVITF